jgi:AcrR family transcriptional regulator
MKNTEDRILQAAIRVFARDGVTGATTRKIALAAKVNEVTLFRHFKTKEELLRRVVAQKSKYFEHVFIEAPIKTKADLKKTVHAFAASYARALLDNEEFIRTFFGELNRHPDLCRRLFVESAKPVRLKLIAFLQAAQKSKLIRKDLDATISADSLTGMLLIGMIRRPLTESAYSFDRYIKNCLDIFLKGIEP